MKLKYLTTLFTLILLVCLPLTSAQDATPATTLSPVIDVTLPQFHNQVRIDISGATQAGADLRLYVNNQIHSRIPEAANTFAFNSVPLRNGDNTLRIDGTLNGQFNSRAFNVFVDLTSPQINFDQPIPSTLDTTDLTISGTITEIANLTIIVNNHTLLQQQTDTFSQILSFSEGSNTVKMIAADAANNQEVKDYTVVVDTQPPELIDVAPLEDSAFYYEGRAVDDVSGKTEPGARVYMYISPSFLSSQELTGLTSDKIIEINQYQTTADSSGNFRFSNIDFEHPLPVLESLIPQQVSPSEQRTATQSLQTDEKTAKVYLVVVDAVGLTVQQIYSVGIGSCFSGSFDFTIKPVSDLQTPSLLSPDRLDAGTELISFVLNMDYRGRSSANRFNATGNLPDDFWEVTGIVIEPACRRDLFLERDPSYQYACQILPNTAAPPPQPINVENTNWYVRYNLKQTSQFTNFSTDFWKTLNNNELKFPFKITVQYNEKFPGKNIESNSQTLCHDVAYFVDVPIDPRKVLPDWMIDDGQKNINQTIENINKVLEPLETIINYLGLACLGGTLLRFTLQVYRRFAETWAITSCQLAQTANSKQICYITSQKILEKCYYVKSGDTPPIPEEANKGLSLCTDPGVVANAKDSPQINKMIDLSESKNADKFTQVIYAWKAEENLYKLYRAVCDRVFCHAAPAAWTQDKSVAEIKQAQYKERGCSPDAASSRSLTQIDNCYETHGPKGQNNFPAGTNKNSIPKNRCYALGNNIYAVDKDNPNQLKKIDKNSGDSSLLVVKKGESYYTADTKTCQEVCNAGEGGPWEAGCFVPKQTSSTQWYHYGPTANCWKEHDTTFDCYCKKSQEKSWSDEKKQLEQKGAFVAGLEKGGGEKLLDKNDQKVVTNLPQGDPESTPQVDPITGQPLASTLGELETYNEITYGYQESPGKWPWSYRQSQIYRSSNGQSGVYYPKERYYSDRDITAAFGADYMLDYIFPPPTTTEVNPFTQHIGAVQSLCLTGIHERLKMVKRILTGMDNCLQQIKTTGKADAGVCKEIFTQYLCNLVSQVFTMFEDKCTAKSFSDADKKHDEPNLLRVFKTGTSAISNSLDGMSKEISDDYGNANLNSFLKGGTRNIVKKVCLLSFGIDVGFDMDAYVDAAYSTPFKTSAAVFSSEGAKGKREFLGFDPTTKESLYEYRAGWTIFPGCDIESYTVDLAAVTEKERRQYNLDCSAVGKYGCDNLGGSSERTKPFYLGTSLSQGNYVDKNDGQVIPDIYRYDHFKITLNLNPNWDAEKCFPSENRDGNQAVFYFPIYDITTADIKQCHVDFSTGKFICSVPGLESYGQAWIEKVQCEDPATGDWKDCSRITYSATPTNGTYDHIKVKVDTYTSGQKQCLKGFVQTAYAGQQPETTVWWDIIGLGQPRTIPVEMSLVPQIDDILFRGTSRHSVTPSTALSINVINYPAIPVQPFDIYFASNTNNQGGQLVGTTPHSYQIVPANQPLTQAWSSFNANQALDFQGFRFTVNNVDLRYGNNSVSQFYITNKTTITHLAAPSNTGQTWNLFVELYNPNSNNRCDAGGTTKILLPSGLAYRPEKTVPLSVKLIRSTSPEMISYSQGVSNLNQNIFSAAATNFQQTVSFGSGSLTELMSYYLYVYAKVKQGAGENNNAKQYRTSIIGMITLFKNRDFSSQIKNTPEYHMIANYLNLVSRNLQSGAITIPTSSTPTPCTDNNCQKIDQYWKELDWLLGIKNYQFYNPVEGKLSVIPYTGDKPVFSEGMDINQINAIINDLNIKQIFDVKIQTTKYVWNTAQNSWLNQTTKIGNLSTIIQTALDQDQSVVLEEKEESF